MKVYMSNIGRIKNVSDMEKKLSASELIQYSKFSNKTRKLQYLLAHAIVFDACGENVIVNKNGAPTIKNGFVSIAHRDNWVVVAISDFPVGIDIENTSINRDFMGESEVLKLPKTNDAKTFYKNFVQYESEFKFGNNAAAANKYFYEIDDYLIGICTTELLTDICFLRTE